MHGPMYIKYCKNLKSHLIYRVARSRLTRLKFEYCANTIACHGWREGEW